VRPDDIPYVGDPWHDVRALVDWINRQTGGER